MFKFLALLLLLGVFGFLILGVFLGRVIRFFGSTDRRKTNNNNSANNRNSNPTNETQKKFSKNEGEYISYEEVKDDE